VIIKFARLVSRYPLSILFASLLLTILLGSIANDNLTTSKGIGAMLPADDPKFSSYMEILQKFPNESNIALLVEGDRAEMIKYVIALDDTLSKMEHLVLDFNYKRKNEEIEVKSLANYNINELDAYENMLFTRSLTKSLEIYNEKILSPFVDSSLFKSDEQRLSKNIAKIERFLNAIIDFEIAYLYDPRIANVIARDFTDIVVVGEPYYFSPKGDALIAYIEPSFNIGYDSNGNEIDTFELSDRVNELTEIVKGVARGFNVKAGTAGALAIQGDELKALADEEELMTFSSLLAVILIFLLFFLFFRMITSPIISMVTVLCSLVWTIGLISISINDLVVFSMGVLIVVFGLGIDFCIHIYSEYATRINRLPNSEDAFIKAMEGTLIKVGPGILMGAITTSIAFATLSFSSAQIMSQMGVIAGIGIMLQLIGSFTILPGAIKIIEKLRIVSTYFINRLIGHFKVSGEQIFSNKMESDNKINYFPLYRLSVWSGRNSKLVLPVIIVFTLFMTWASSNIEYDYNMMNLEPKGMQSVENQKKIVEKFSIMTDYVMIYIPIKNDGSTDREELSRVIGKLSDYETIGYIQSIDSFIPSSDYRVRLARNKHLLNKFTKGNETSNIKDFLTVLNTMGNTLRKINRIVESSDFDKYSLKDRMSSILANNGLFDSVLTTYSKRKTKEKGIYDALNSIYLSRLIDIRKMMFSQAAIESANINSISMIPPNLRRSFAIQESSSESGYSLIVRAYPKRNFWEDQNYFKNFVNDVTNVSKAATGLPIVMLNLLDSFASYGKISMLLSVLFISIILFIDFRDYRMVLIALSVLIIGTIWMVGFMYLLGLKLNMANIMVVPLIIGIGIDDALHILHRYIIEGSLRISYGTTGKAILVTTLTTIIGFGSLAVSSFPTLYHMGFTLSIGALSCYLVTIFLVPALLKSISLK